MYDVTIIGAGVVGATKANSAIVHAGFDAECGSLKAKLNVQGSKMMKQVTEELSVKYINNGSLVIGFNDDDRQVVEQLLKRGVENGVEGLRVLERDRTFGKRT